MFTQETKLYMKTMKAMNIEEFRNKVKRLNCTNRIEKEFQIDLLEKFSIITEEDYLNAKEETGIFFFLYDYEKRRK